jgi:hypothetical protein
MMPGKGEVIQFKGDCNPYISGQRYEVRGIDGARIRYDYEGPGESGHGYMSLEHWLELKARAEASA